MKKIVIFFLIILFTIIQNIDAAFYNMPRGSYSLSLGGAAAAYIDDASAAYYNPSFLPLLSHHINLEVYTHKFYGISGLGENFVAGAFNKSGFGLGIAYFSDYLKNIYTESNLFASFGFSYKKMNFGISYIMRGIDAGQYSSRFNDLNMSINYNEKYFSVSVIAKNIMHPAILLINKTEKLPFRISPAISVSPQKNTYFLLSSDDLSHPIATYHFGIQYIISRTLFIRMGVMPNIYSGGIGIKYKFVDIDFAVENADNLGLYSLLTLKLNFLRRNN